MPGKRVNKRVSLFGLEAFLTIAGSGKRVLKVKKDQILFSQGDASDALFYILTGKVKLIAASTRGKEALFAVLGRAHFFGEACLSAQQVRIGTATSMAESRIIRIEKATMVRVLREEPAFFALFMSYMLSRNIRIEEDLVDHLFNSSEKRLAHILLLLAHFGEETKTDAVIPKISQEALAGMIGISRSKIGFFMNKFKKRGFIDNLGGLHVHGSLLNILLHD
jgi:CRP-like cAMP-binding protein